MPHYEDGTIARAGDWVRGTTYNQPKVVEGVVLKITAETEVCNCVVAFIGDDDEYREDYTAVKDLTRKGRLPREIEWFENDPVADATF